jgi:hypothetical protein
MKKVVIVTIKLLLVILFLQNIGFFSFVSNIDTDHKPLLKADHGKSDIEYLNGKIRLAENLGKKYSPEQYFEDISEIRLKEKNNEFDYRAAPFVNSSMSSMMTVLQNSINYHRHNDSEAEFQIFMQKFTTAQKKCSELIDPGQEKDAQEFAAKTSKPIFWFNLLISILTWLAGFYLKNLPLGFVLLWAWWYEEKERLSINNPLSFLICVLLYPVVIIRVWRRSLRYGARMFAMNIEFKRRQTDIFAMISNNELEDIKRFARSDFKLRDYQRYLENRSLIVRHSLVPVGIVALTLLLTPKVYSSVDNHSTINTTEYQMPIKAPPNLMPDDFSSHHDLIMVAITPEETKIFFIPLIWQFNLPPVLKYVGGFKTNPDPVPVCC